VLTQPGTKSCSLGQLKYYNSTHLIFIQQKTRSSLANLVKARMKKSPGCLLSFNEKDQSLRS